MVVVAGVPWVGFASYAREGIGRIESGASVLAGPSAFRVKAALEMGLRDPDAVPRALAVTADALRDLWAADAGRRGLTVRDPGGGRARFLDVTVPPEALTPDSVHYRRDHFTQELWERLSCFTGERLATERGWRAPPSSLLLGAATCFPQAPRVRPMHVLSSSEAMRRMTEDGERPLLLSLESVPRKIHGVPGLDAYVAFLHDLFHVFVPQGIDLLTREAFLLLDDCVAALPADLDAFKPLLHEAFRDGPNLRPRDIAKPGIASQSIAPESALTLLFATARTYLTDMFGTYSDRPVPMRVHAAALRVFATRFPALVARRMEGHPRRAAALEAFDAVFRPFLEKGENT